MKFKNSGRHIASAFFVIALMIAGVYFLFPYAISIIGGAIKLLLPFILGYFFSLAINPFADKLAKKLKLPRGISAIFVIILTVALVGGIVFGVVWKLVDEVKSLYEHYPQIYEECMILFRNISDKYSDIYEMMPDGIQRLFDNMKSQLSKTVTDFFSRVPVMERAGDFAKGLPGIFIAVIVFFMSLYFMVVDAKRVKHFFGKIIPVGLSEKMYNIRLELRKYMGGYVKAQGIIMSIAFVIIFTGLSILKVDYAILIAIGIAILDALPFFGSGAVLWPWIIISFLNSSFGFAIGLIIIYLLILFTRQMIEPKIVSDRIGLHPIFTLISMYTGYKLFSIGGMLLGPITLMFIISFYKAGIFSPIIRFITAIWKYIKYEFEQIKNLFLNE